MKKNTKEWTIFLLLCLAAVASVISAVSVSAASYAGQTAVSGDDAPISGKWVSDDGRVYFMKSDGTLYRGWLTWKDHIYYLTRDSGYRATGFRSIEGKRYYFRPNNGKLVTDRWFKVDGKKYYASAKGILKIGWFHYDGGKYYMSKKGAMRTGWVKIDGKKYYFYDNGKMAVKTWLDDKHYVDKNGALQPAALKKKKDTFRWPLKRKWNSISSYFGYRGPMPVGTSDHDGIDIPADTDTPIRAGAAGTIVECSYSDSAGNHIEIDHNNGLSTQYMHMVRFHPKMKAGKKVKRGQVIGYVGSTGWSTGPHLHFGVKLNGVLKDPLEFVRQP